MKRSKSFRTQLYLLLIVSVTIPVLIVASMFSWYYSGRLIEENRRNHANTINAVAASIQAHFDELDRIAFSPYLYKDMLSTMLYIKNGFVLDPPSFLDQRASEDSYVMNFSKQMFTAKQGIRSIAFYPAGTRDDYVYAIQRNAAGLQTRPTEPYFAQAWYQSVQQQGEAYLLLEKDPAEPAHRRPHFALVTMVRDLDSKKDIGALRIEVSADRIFNALDEIELTGDAMLLLADENGTVLYRAGNGGEPTPDVQDDTALEEGFMVTRTALARSGWELIHLSPRSEMWTLQAFTFLIAFAICLAITLVAFLIYQRETKGTVASVNNILHTLRRMEQGDFAAKSEVGGRNELATIARGVNHMGEKVSTHIDREYKAVIERQNAEYRALQAQINPHFLYNTLNDFIALNRMRDQQKLEESILQLTQLFRYTCTPADTTTVKEEIDFCEKYLLLRKLQLEERLSFAIEIQPGAGGIIIPKFILQPLIENSLLHGMGNTKNSLSVRIMAALAEDGRLLRLVVDDDGLGFNPDNLPAGRPRVGTANVRERLSIFCPGAALTIVSEPEQGTVCTISIPLAAPEEED